MSEWSYVAIAYVVVWGSLAIYAVALARRATQATHVARELREAARDDQTAAPGADTVCDTPPAP